MNRQIIALAAAAASVLPVCALRTASIYSDHMVLQQQTQARISGFASPGKRVSITPSWPGAATATAVTGRDGRWQVSVTTPEASYTPYTINISTPDSTVNLSDVLVGEVWIASGQSNMEMPLRGFWTQPVRGARRAIATARHYPGVRMATVPKAGAYEPKADTDTRWLTSTPANATDFSALAYFFARHLNDLLDVPVGIISCAYGGSKVEGWLPKRILDTYPHWNMDAERDSTLREWERIGVMYNAMLLPVAPYTARGFLWNQGESNVGRHDEYPRHQADMVAHWRELWGDSTAAMPFYFVELPGWEYSDPQGTDAALFRECQHRAAQLIPNSGIVCTSDLVDETEIDDIHASRKEEIGERMALMAGARTYGIDGLPYTYPTFRSMDIDGDTATLHFDNASHGFTPNENLQGFEVAGTDGVFHPAEAREVYDTRDIAVTRPAGVDRICAVRYCFRNFAVGRVHDLYGMPLVPFRTDR